MPALCLTTDLSSSEMAAWVQAIGSLLAIGVAVGLAIWERKRAHRDLAVARSEARRKASTAVHRYGSALLELLNECALSVREDSLRANLPVARDLVTWPDRYATEALSRDAEQCLLKMRICAARTVGFIEHHVETLMRAARPNQSLSGSFARIDFSKARVAAAQHAATQQFKATGDEVSRVLGEFEEIISEEARLPS
ncbi:MAG: hypothetical protein GC151_14015 [Betaproteobacteria bacterium]|nr:hypothetical protein [Betaproteobacteria bacterium]